MGKFERRMTMKEYFVEITKKKNGYGYAGEWGRPWDDATEAESPEEAADLCRDWLADHGDDPEKYVFRTRAEGGEWVNV